MISCVHWRVRAGLAVILLTGTVMAAHAYIFHCTHMAQMLSEPQIMTRMRTYNSSADTHLFAYPGTR